MAPRRRMKKRTARAKTTVDKKQSRQIATLKRQLAPELKHYDFAFSVNDVNVQNTNAVQSFNMCYPLQGSTQITRVGDSITLKGFWFRMSGLASATNNWIRIMIVHDRRMFLTALAGADLLLNYSTTSTSDYNAHSTYNPDIVNDRFSKGKSVDVLYDKTIYFGSNAQSDKLRQSLHIVKTYKGGKKINFSGANTATGQVYCYIFPGNSSVAGNNPAISVSGTSYYSDI